MKKSCGGCSYWRKVKAMKGLCLRDDGGWCPSDNVCPQWKGKKYQRERQQINCKSIIEFNK